MVRGDAVASHREHGRSGDPLMGARVNQSTRKKVFKRDQYMCLNCGVRGGHHEDGVPVRLTIDHIRPLARGGPPVAQENLQTLCSVCNDEKGDMTMGEWAMMRSLGLVR